MDKVTAGLGGGTNITGAAESLAEILSDIDRVLFVLENGLGIAEPERCAKLLDTTPEATSGVEKGMNLLIGKAIGIRLRIRRVDTEFTSIITRLGTMDEEIANANQ